MPPQSCDVTDQEWVGGTLECGRDQGLGVARPPTCPGATSGREAEVGPLGGGVGEGCRAFVRRKGCDVPAASLRPGAHELEGADHFLVRPVGGAGSVPGLAVRIPGAGQRLGQGPVRPAPVLPVAPW